MAKLSKVDQVYQYVLNEIASEHYRKGEHLVISKIAEICNVSDIPVREAMRALQRDGYIEILPNQGATVKGIGKETISAIVQIKGVLEGFATRLSIDYLSPNDINELQRINLEQAEAVRNGNGILSSELNQKFHMTIYRHLPQKELYEMISELWKKWSFTKNIFSISPSVRNQSYEEHEQILQLIRERKYEQVEACVREHKFKAIASWASDTPGQEVAHSHVD